MKTHRVSLLLCALLFLAGCKQAGRVVERPPLASTSTTTIEIAKVQLTDTATILDIQAYFRPKNWIRVAKTTVLRDERGHTYPILKGIGITVDSLFWMPDSGEASFQLVFEPMPKSTKSFDFIEGEMTGAYCLWGVRLDGKHPEVQVPNPVTVNSDFALPEPEAKYGKATLKGKYLGFVKGMPANGNLVVFNPANSESTELSFTVADDGGFEVQTNLATVASAIIDSSTDYYECLLAPGQTTSIFINLPEIARQQSHLHKDDASYGKVVYYDGYLAGVQQELNDNKQNHTGFAERYSNSVMMNPATNTFEGLKKTVLELHKAYIDSIEHAPVCAATKEIMKANVEVFACEMLLSARNVLVSGMLRRNELAREKAQETYGALKVPTGFLDDITAFHIDTKAGLYIRNFINTYTQLLMPRLKLQPTGLLATLIEVNKLSQSIADYQPFTAAQKAEIAKLPSAFGEMLSDMNTALLVQIQDNKAKGGYAEKDVPQVSNDKLFDAMMKNYSGHTVLVDFWATWCGPCLNGHKMMAPMKEELKDKDIVYVYISGVTSPRRKWEAMIPDIPGDHYYVYADQWNALLKQFKTEGIPTYVVVNKHGKVSNQQIGFSGAESIKEMLLKALSE